MEIEYSSLPSALNSFSSELNKSVIINCTSHGFKTSQSKENNMIIQQIDSKELLGEQIGSAAKDKINKLVYWLVGIVLIGGLSNMYLLSRGLVKGWVKTKIQHVNR